MEKIRLPFLEADVTTRCNLNCLLCSHYIPYLKDKSDYDLGQFELDVSAMSTVATVDVFKVQGGEPLLLGEKLLDYIHIVRNYNLSDKFVLFTNGILLLEFEEDFFEDFEYVCISHYPSVGLREAKEKFTNRNKFKFMMKPRMEVYHVKEGTDSEVSWNNCQIKNRCNMIYNGHFCKGVICFRVGEFLKKTFEDVSCKIHEENFKNRFVQYHNRTKPLESCNWCKGGR